MIQSFDYLTGEFLRTFAGAVFATNILVHFIKDYLPQQLDKKIITLVVSILIVLTNVIVFEGFSGEALYIGGVNGFLVAAAAMGNYEILTRQTKREQIRRQQNLANPKNGENRAI